MPNHKQRKKKGGRNKSKKVKAMRLSVETRRGEGLSMSNLVWLMVGSGRALPPFPPLGEHAILSTVSGVISLSGAAKTRENRRV